jgi:hypothetical protein
MAMVLAGVGVLAIVGWVGMWLVVAIAMLDTGPEYRA